MSNHYKATIARLEESRLKLIQDIAALRDENEKLQKKLNRAKAKVKPVKAKQV